VSGVVLKRSIDPGQTVQAAFSTPSLFIIAEDLTQMKLEVAVDEADVGQVHEGQAANFVVDAYPGRTFPARITRVNLGAKSLAGGAASNAVSTANVVSYLANLTLSNADLALRPGMTATATITTAGEKNVLMAPNAALRFTPTPTPDRPAAKSRGLALRPPGAGGTVVQQERGIGAGSRQVVYVLEVGKSVWAVSVVTGQTDGRFTAVTATGLQAGMALITGQKARPPGG
jgi:HlyD family secretion protein